MRWREVKICLKSLCVQIAPPILQVTCNCHANLKIAGLARRKNGNMQGAGEGRRLSNFHYQVYPSPFVEIPFLRGTWNPTSGIFPDLQGCHNDIRG